MSQIYSECGSNVKTILYPLTVLCLLLFDYFVLLLIAVGLLAANLHAA
jgi:hypothetical protein